MVPIVRIVSGGEPDQIFIPIEDSPVVLSELRKSLPKLKRALRKKWPVESVYIDVRCPRMRNSFEAWQASHFIVEGAIGLAIIFGGSMLRATLRAAGKKIGESLGNRFGDEIKPFVKKWLKNQFGKDKPGHARSIHPGKRHAAKRHSKRRPAKPRRK